MVATSRSNSIGLLSNSLHPAASAFSCSPASACAERAMTGMSRVCGLFLSRRVASQPSTTGISRSIRMISGLLDRRHLAALLAVLRSQQLEIAEQLKPHLEHIDVVLVVFDLKHFGHDADSMPLATAARVTTSRRMRSTRSPGRNVSLTSTDWTPQFNRSRALASRSSAVITMTGMSRQG